MYSNYMHKRTVVRLCSLSNMTSEWERFPMCFDYDIFLFKWWLLHSTFPSISTLCS